MPRRNHAVLTAPPHVAGDTRVASRDVVVERWDHAPLVERVGHRLRCGRGGPALAVGSVNIDHFHHFGRGRIELRNEPERTGVDWVMLADGAPVAARAAVAAGRRWPRITGADLLPDLLREAHAVDAPVGFLGGTPEVHTRIRGVLRERHPRLRAHFWAPGPEEIDTEAGSARIAAEIQEAGVGLLAVALGKPRQELWIQRFGRRTGSPVLLAFGASADFMAGKVRRAPRWVQDVGLEWAYRLAQEPRRLARRYLLQGPPALIRLLPAQRIDVRSL